MLSGELVTGDKALSFGLVNFLTTKELLEPSVIDFAQKLIQNNSIQSMELTKKMIADIQSLPLSEALDYAARMNARARTTEDCKKGIQAFLEKRDLTW